MSKLQLKFTQFSLQKTQGLSSCVAGFTKEGRKKVERRSRSKIVLLFNTDKKEPCVRKFEGLTRSKILGILQTEFDSTAESRIEETTF